jgi:hypothetical protein
VEKPVAILRFARATWANDSLREVLRTMSARLIEEAAVTFDLGTNRIDEELILSRPELCSALTHSFVTLEAAVRTPPRSP